MSSFDLNGRFASVLLTAQRVAQLERGASPAMPRQKRGDILLALDEVKRGLVDRADLKTAVVDSFKKGFAVQDSKDRPRPGSSRSFIASLEDGGAGKLDLFDN